MATRRNYGPVFEEAMIDRDDIITELLFCTLVFQERKTSGLQTVMYSERSYNINPLENSRRQQIDGIQ